VFGQDIRGSKHVDFINLFIKCVVYTKLNHVLLKTVLSKVIRLKWNHGKGIVLFYNEPKTVFLYRNGNKKNCATSGRRLSLFTIHPRCVVTSCGRIGASALRGKMPDKSTSCFSALMDG